MGEKRTLQGKTQEGGGRPVLVRESTATRERGKMRALGVLAAGAAVLALFVAGGVAAAPSHGVSVFNCGTANRIAGHSWAIRSSKISCGTARGVVRQLARQTVPPGNSKIGIFGGTYAGMRCLGGPPGHRPRTLSCVKVVGVGAMYAGILR
jgi:hypothetical protein